MVFQNSDRSHQKEQKTRDLEKSIKKGASKGRAHLDTKKIQKEINTNFKKVPSAYDEISDE